ncbi:MAG: tryptophan--tRNA ligase [Actinomycetaceae bacterium]|nr:tryptophan--tRNA ligase [Actinomycetaceae bacterium]
MTTTDNTTATSASNATQVEQRLAEATNEASLKRSIARSAQLEEEIDKDPSRFRILTGDRPTGNLHLGHYFGTLHNRVILQNRGIDTWIVIADYQVITDREGVGPIRDRVFSLLADYMACGIDPKRSTIFTHSAIPALNQLMLPFLSLVTEAELHRNPTVKAELDASERPMSGLLLTYPVHQAADILFCQANLVPVGKDQLPHLEQARVIADRFEKRYRRKSDLKHPVFRRPEALLSQANYVLGLDGQKMSKSKGNTVELGMSADQVAKAVKRAKTDADRHITYDPDNRPEVANLLQLTCYAGGASSPQTLAEEIGDGGAGVLKARLTEALNEMLEPIRTRRQELLESKDYLQQVLREGNQAANEVGNATLEDVRHAMNMIYEAHEA